MDGRHKNCPEQFLTSHSDGPKGGRQGWQAIKKPHLGAAFDSSVTHAAIEPLSLFIAFFSNCRMRSADTLYLAAKSCSVAFSSASQR